MKLFELIYPKMTRKSVGLNTTDFDHLKSRIANSRGYNTLGTGSFGKALQRDDDRGSVFKTATGKTKLDKDGYFRYMNAIIQSSIASSNPYIPRFFNVRAYDLKDSTENLGTYIAEMETLHKFDSLNIEELLYVGDKAFFEFENIVNRKERFNRGLSSGRASKKYHKSNSSLTRQKTSFPRGKNIMEDALIHLLEYAFIGTNSLTNVKDPLLKQAIMFIKKINIQMNKKIQIFDIHEGNIMVRRTPAGPQLVITDPLV